MLKKGDLLLVAVLLLLVAAGYFFASGRTNSSGGRIAVIKQGEEVIGTIDLEKVKEAQRITVSGDYTNVILVEKGRIRFETADCPDKVCVKTGWLTREGNIAVCLPNRVIVKIQGENDEIDAVIG